MWLELADDREGVVGEASLAVELVGTGIDGVGFVVEDVGPLKIFEVGG